MEDLRLNGAMWRQKGVSTIRKQRRAPVGVGRRGRRQLLRARAIHGMTSTIHILRCDLSSKPFCLD